MWLCPVNISTSLTLTLLTEVKPSFVWDLYASARWAHTPLSLKRGIWLCIRDAGPPRSPSHWMLSDCLMTVYCQHYTFCSFSDFDFFPILSICAYVRKTKLSIVMKWWCWMVLICVQTSVRDWSRTRQWLCCRLRSTMLPCCLFSVCHVFMLVLCLSSAEDFDWTKNDHSSFYYGTFPAGKRNLFLSSVGCSSFSSWWFYPS